MATVEAKIRAQLIDEASGKAREIAASLRTVEASASSAGTKGAGAAREHAAALEQLSASEREAAAAASATEANVERAALAHRQAAAAAEDQATASARAGASSGQAAGGFLKVDAAAKAQGRAVAENVNLVSELALGFGNLSPATQGAALAFAGAGNNAFALANALGPIGPAIAVALGLLPAAIGAWMKYADAAKGAATAAREARQAFLDQIDAAQRLRDAEQRERELLRGERSAEEQEVALGVARENAQKAQARGTAVTTGQVGENGLLARVAGALGGRGLRAAAAQVTGSELVSAIESFASVAPIPGLEGVAQGIQNRETAATDTTAQRRDQLDSALGIARRREAREAERTALQQQVEGAAALQASTEADIRRRFGPGARGQRQADALIASLGSAQLDGRDRIELDAAGSRAARGLSDEDRAAVLGRSEELLQAQRRAAAAEEALRQEAIAAARASNAEERLASPTARPDLALREGGGELSQLLTRYIEADRGDPQAQTRAIEALTRAAESLERTARDGTSVRVSVDQGGGGSAPPISFAGVGTSGR